MIWHSRSRKRLREIEIKDYESKLSELIAILAVVRKGGECQLGIL